MSTTGHRLMDELYPWQVSGYTLTLDEYMYHQRVLCVSSAQCGIVSVPSVQDVPATQEHYSSRQGSIAAGCESRRTC